MALGVRQVPRRMWWDRGGPGHDLWFKQVAPWLLSQHRCGDSLCFTLCFPFCRQDSHWRSLHCLGKIELEKPGRAAAPLLRWDMEGFTNFPIRHIVQTLCSCQTPIVHVYIVLGVLMSQPLQSFGVGKRGHCLLRADPASQPARCLFSQPSLCSARPD